MIMEIEKRRFKGGFLSFFDWNGKSQNKMFSNNPRLPEVSKQAKESKDNMTKSLVNKIKIDDNGANPSNIASNDFDCAISISSDEGYGTKPPGLVARLMGLDSLPVSTVSEPSSSNSLYDSNSFGSSHCQEGALHSMAECWPVDSIDMQLKPVKSSLGAMDSKTQKVGNPAIKRFQTEMLPPKSAKSIPVSHSKLLSPIKSPGHVHHKNAVHIMEAATKIIKASPRSCVSNRMSSVAPSSVPLRIIDLKEKLEAAEYESKFMALHTANPLNGKPSRRSNNIYKSAATFKSSGDSEKNSSRQLASKGKSVSPAIPSKTDVQLRDALTSNGKRGYMKQNEQNKIKSNQLSRRQKKACKGQNSNVLGQNNQKQNSLPNQGKSTSKVYSNKPTRTWSSESSVGAKKSTNKGVLSANIELKRSGTRVTDTLKESKSKNISQKKKHSSADVRNKAGGYDNAVVNKYENKSIKCNITTDGNIDQDAFSMKESNDVISFTFTSPLNRNMPESESSTEQVMGTENRIDVNSCSLSHMLNPKKLTLSPPRLHVIDGDALSVLLEKTLQELTSRINPPHCTPTMKCSSGGLRLEDKFQCVASTTAREQDRNFHPVLLNNKLDSMHDNCCSSSDNMVLSMNLQLQSSEPMEETGCSSISDRRNDLNCQHAGAVTVFENLSVSESCLDSEESAHGGTVYSSVQDEEVSNFSPISESISLKNEVKWSEKSSSIMMVDNMAIEQSNIMSNSVDFTRSARNMELEYVKYILSNTELMTEEFVVGQIEKIIMPNLFDLLENKSTGAENYELFSKPEKKAIFDTLNECLELRCRQVFVGTCKSWPRWDASVQRKNCLAEELYKEMLDFRSMEEDVVVDELVSKDMSIRWGGWLDFDIEAFEEGSQLEFDIVTCLINELVSDLWHI